MNTETRISPLQVSGILFLLSTLGLLGCSGSDTPAVPIGSGSTGGDVASGGSQGTGGVGTVATGGGQASGGSPSTGGINSTGGSLTTGGSPATGGSSATSVTNTGGRNSVTGGTSGLQATGGRSTTGGGVATGGTVGSTGGKSAGGTSGAGGTTTTGGKSAAGGTVTTTGGATTAGGTTAAGGTAVAGGPGTGYPENTGANCVATAAPLLTTQNKKLPNPFAMHDGSIISSKAQWECRRNEIKKDIEKYEIGTKPEPPTVTATYSGGKLSVVVTTSSGSITLTSTVSGSGSCVVIGMNSATTLVSGCTQVPFAHDQVVQYANGGGTQYQSDPFYKVYPSLFGKVGNYTAWSWGISRIIDGLELVKSQMNIDTTKIATWGCSYAGKMSLFGAALDERVALGIVEESGGGGINAWRTSQDFVTRTGTNIEKIDNTSYSWFLSSMKSLDPYKLPHDHHELIAMMAPRAAIILGNDDYDWLGDESGYKSTMAAIEVFKALGVGDHIGYDFTSGHGHCQAPATQIASVKTFVDRFLKGGTGATNIAIKPPKTSFDLNYSAVIDWTTPTLQ